MRVRRSLLFVPGDSRRKIEKAVTLGADVICLDLEDGVALNQKQAARDSTPLLTPKKNAQSAQCGNREAAGDVSSSCPPKATLPPLPER
jgi:hypothetical protein